MISRLVVAIVQMRRHSIGLAVCLCVLSALSARSTTFSVNAVGFVNKTFKPGITAAHNPLAAVDNRVSELFAHAPVGTVVYSPGPSGLFENATKTVSGWMNGGLFLPPGRGFYVNNTGTADFTVTFVGNVLQGELTHHLLPGTSLAGSLVPQTGLISTDLHFPADIGDAVLVFDGTGPAANRYEFTVSGWMPHEPVLEVGDSMWITTARELFWTRNFNVNNSLVRSTVNDPIPSTVIAYPLSGGESAIYEINGFSRTQASVPQPEINFVATEADGSLLYRVFTEAGRDYQIESSPDLANWSEFAAFTAATSEHRFNVGRPGNTGRYFRVRTL